MHLLECHFKVAELKMHLRSLVPGAVSRRVGWEVVLGEWVGGGSGGVSQRWGEACVFLVERGELVEADPWRFLKMAKYLALKRHQRTLASGWGRDGFVTFTSSEIATASSPVHPQSSSKNTSRG